MYNGKLNLTVYFKLYSLNNFWIRQYVQFLDQTVCKTSRVDSMYNFQTRQYGQFPNCLHSATILEINFQRRQLVSDNMMNVD